MSRSKDSHHVVAKVHLGEVHLHAKSPLTHCVVLTHDEASLAADIKGLKREEALVLDLQQMVLDSEKPPADWKGKAKRKATEESQARNLEKIRAELSALEGKRPDEVKGEVVRWTTSIGGAYRFLQEETKGWPGIYSVAAVENKDAEDEAKKEAKREALEAKCLQEVKERLRLKGLKL